MKMLCRVTLHHCFGNDGKKKSTLFQLEWICGSRFSHLYPAVKYKLLWTARQALCVVNTSWHFLPGTSQSSNIDSLASLSFTMLSQALSFSLICSGRSHFPLFSARITLVSDFSKGSSLYDFSPPPEEATPWCFPVIYWASWSVEIGHWVYQIWGQWLSAISITLTNTYPLRVVCKEVWVTQPRWIEKQSIEGVLLELFTVS